MFTFLIIFSSVGNIASFGYDFETATSDFLKFLVSIISTISISFSFLNKKSFINSSISNLYLNTKWKYLSS